jgi:hypothetical protein
MYDEFFHEPGGDLPGRKVGREAVAFSDGSEGVVADPAGGGGVPGGGNTQLGFHGRALYFLA